MKNLNQMEGARSLKINRSTGPENEKKILLNQAPRDSLDPPSYYISVQQSSSSQREESLGSKFGTFFQPLLLAIPSFTSYSSSFQNQASNHFKKLKVFLNFYGIIHFISKIENNHERLKIFRIERIFCFK